MRASTPGSAGAGSTLRSAVWALGAACALATFAQPAHAAPAKPNTIKTVHQPDGSRLELRLWGDEHAHGYETLSGHTVVYDARDRTYEFAARGAAGWLRPSGRRATATGGPAAARGLRPTADAIEKERRSELAAQPISPLMRKAGPAWADQNTKIPFLAVEFSDVDCQFTPGQQHTHLFGGGATGPGDLDDYYREVSLGQFELEGSVIGQSLVQCLELPDDREYYNSGAESNDDAIAEAAVAAADAHVDFSQYDNDGDFQVDSVGIIYAGGGPHDGCSSVDVGSDGRAGDSLWPHAGQIEGPGIVVDGVLVDRFTIQPEVSEDDGSCDNIAAVNVIAHEFGHALGLPDLYDTDVGTGGVGDWSLMGTANGQTVVDGDTPPHLDAWSKAVLGWVTPHEHAPDDLFAEELTQVETSGEVHQFLPNPMGFEAGGGVGQYFLVENRQRVGFDAALPGCGLLVWHIDEAMENNKEGGSSATAHRLVDVDEADGLDDLNFNRPADDGDPFPGSTGKLTYGDDTIPNSRLYPNVTTGVRMRVHSRECASGMDAVFGPNNPPVAEAGGPYQVSEGTNAQLDGQGSSDPDGDPLTYEWERGNGDVFATGATAEYTDVGDEAERLIGLRVTDKWGERDLDGTDVIIENAAPAVTTLAASGTAPEGQSVQVTATVTDPGWLDTPSATIDWGDGSGPQPVTGVLENERPDATLTIEVTHVYGDNGTFAVKLCPSDDDGANGACETIDVTIGNVPPMAAIDKSDAVVVNGTETVFARTGEAAALEGRLTDPGSDDLTSTWSWGDGSPDTVTKHRVDPVFDDPFPSPSIAPREVTDSAGHAFTACLYAVGFRAVDDDGGASPTDTVQVLATGNADHGRSSGYWAHQYRGDGQLDHSEEIRECYLEIAGYISRVFNEERDASTLAAAQSVLFAQGSAVTKRDQLDRDLLTAWLNFANGAVGYAELVDTDGDGTADTAFHVALETAETVRLDPDATPSQIDAQRTIVSHINDTI